MGMHIWRVERKGTFDSVSVSTFKCSTCPQRSNPEGWWHYLHLSKNRRIFCGAENTVCKLHSEIFLRTGGVAQLVEQLPSKVQGPEFKP
jgi:hypothetical protein